MIALLALIAVLLFVLEGRTLNLPTSKLQYDIIPSALNVEQGEEFKLTSVFTNRTGRTLSFVDANEYLPKCLEITDLTDTLNDFDKVHNVRVSTFFIQKNERVSRSVTVRCYTRGLHRLTKCELLFGDFLGLQDRIYTRTVNRWVAVYPRKINDERVDRLVKGIMGSISVKSFVFADPVLVRGYHEYTGTEPFHDISFAQSAKMGALYVKEFDHTREETVNVVFDVEFKGNFDEYSDRIETCFSLVREVCERLAHEGAGFRFITNLCCSRLSYTGITVINGDYEKLLEFLTMAGKATSCTVSELLTFVGRELSIEDSEFVYIAQEENRDTMNELDKMRRRYNININTLWGNEFEEAYKNGKIL